MLREFEKVCGQTRRHTERLSFLLKSVGKSLTFRGAVYEAQDILRHHRCKDPICDTHLWKVKHELDMAKIRIRQLEKDLEAHGIKPTQTKYAPLSRPNTV